MPMPDEGQGLEAIARVAHEANRAWCLATGDTSQPSWDEAPARQKTSAINGVSFHIFNPTAGPEASHENWMREKIAEGWHVGPVKDPEAKLHPCLVPFSDLPLEQQAKDRLFRAVVHALAFVDAPA